MALMNSITITKSSAECKPAICEVIEDKATAGRIYDRICHNLTDRRIRDNDLRVTLAILNLLLRDSELFVQQREGNTKYFKTVAIALQRQCCSGSGPAEFLGIMTEGFRAIW